VDLPTFGKPTMPQRKPMSSPVSSSLRAERSNPAVDRHVAALLGMTEWSAFREGGGIPQQRFETALAGP